MSPTRARVVASHLLLACAAATAAPRDLAVTIPCHDGLELAGTLTLPPSTRPVAAVVLVAGSGPTDRDGNQPPDWMPDLLRAMADDFAGHGIATVRYDKRGQYANAGQSPRDPKVLGDFCAWPHYVDDVVAAVTFLRGRAEVNPARVGILGHNEGGLLALSAAADLSRAGRPPSALMLLPTPGRPVDVVMAEQLGRSLRANRFPPALARYVLSQNAAVTRSVRETGQLPAAGVSVWLTAIYPPYIAPFLRGELAVDPPALARAFAGPVLLVYGTADVQVSTERDGSALDAALTGRTPDSHRLIPVPGYGHNLRPVNGDADPGVSGHVPPVTLDALGGWAVDHL